MSSPLRGKSAILLEECRICGGRDKERAKTVSHHNRCNDCYRAYMRDYMRSYSKSGTCERCGEPCTSKATVCSRCWRGASTEGEIRCGQCGEQMVEATSAMLCGFCLSEAPS